MPPIDANVRQLAPAGSYQPGLFISFMGDIQP